MDWECFDFLLSADLTRLDESELKLRVTKSLTDSPLKTESGETACSLPQSSIKSNLDSDCYLFFRSKYTDMTKCALIVKSGILRL